MLSPYNGGSNGKEHGNNMNTVVICGFKELKSSYYIGETSIYIYIYIYIYTYIYIYAHTH